MKNFIAPLLVVLVGCSAPGSNPTDDAADKELHVSPVSPIALSVEQAVRDLDVGHDPMTARNTLEKALQDPAITDATRDVATLALARALDRTGEKERAIASVEELLKKHVDDHPWALEEQADELLQRLVTGTVKQPPREDTSSTSPAPVARALSAFFPLKNDQVRISLFFFGSSGASERLGTFDIGGALRAKKREACPLCDDKIGAHTLSSSASTWTRIPALRSKFDDALVVYYFDLESRRIPARYDELLPMPSADIVARLEKGEGLVAVKQREGAPPMIVLAAPRNAELAEVEEAFAAMKELPAAPVAVNLSGKLRPSEIKSAFRAGFPAYRACAKEYFARVPGAKGGTFTVKFDIQRDGSIVGLTTDAQNFDALLSECVGKVTQGLSFPKSSGKVSVSYPITLTQD